VLAEVEHKEFLKTTLEKFPMQGQDASLVELNKKLRPGDPVTVEGARTALNNLFFNEAKYDLSPVGRYRVNRRLDKEQKEKCTALVKEDVLYLLNHLIKLIHDDGSIDDIDHLGNRRIRAVGEQLQKQMRVGLARLERLVREQMALKGSEGIVPSKSKLISRPLCRW
jgi:DNA-directed RNA polymerase, beta subunit/140 kD subunit